MPFSGNCHSIAVLIRVCASPNYESSIISRNPKPVLMLRFRPINRLGRIVSSAFLTAKFIQFAMSRHQIIRVTGLSNTGLQACKSNALFEGDQIADADGVGRALSRADCHFPELVGRGPSETARAHEPPGRLHRGR
jgi:hypothetical protein